MPGKKYPDFPRLELKAKLDIWLSRVDMTYLKVSQEAGVDNTFLSRILGGYNPFSQPAGRENLLMIIKVLAQKGKVTKDEVEQLFALARHAEPAHKSTLLLEKAEKLLYLYRSLDRENGALEAEILDLLENKLQEMQIPMEDTHISVQEDGKAESKNPQILSSPALALAPTELPNAVAALPTAPLEEQSANDISTTTVVSSLEAPPTNPVVASSPPAKGRVQSPLRVSRRIVLLSGIIGIGLTGGSIILAKTFMLSSAVPVGTHLNFFANAREGIRALAWSRDGKYVAAANDDGTVCVWDVRTSKLIQVYSGHADHVEGVSWSPDGKYIVSGSADGTAKIWNVQTGETRLTYRGHTVLESVQKHPWVNRVQWSADGTMIVSCDQTSSYTSHATVQVWDATTGKTLVVYSEHTNGVYSVAWSPDNKHIASVGYDGTLRVWEAIAPYGKTVVAFPKSRWLFGVAWSPDGKRIVYGGTDFTLWVVNLSDLQETACYRLPFAQGLGIRDIAWSPKGRYIAVSTDGQGIHIIDSITGILQYQFDGIVGDISALGWSPTDAHIAFGGGNGTVYALQIWQALAE